MLVPTSTFKRLLEEEQKEEQADWRLAIMDMCLSCCLCHCRRHFEGGTRAINLCMQCIKFKLKELQQSSILPATSTRFDTLQQAKSHPKGDVKARSQLLSGGRQRVVWGFGRTAGSSRQQEMWATHPLAPSAVQSGAAAAAAILKSNVALAGSRTRTGTQKGLKCSLSPLGSYGFHFPDINCDLIDFTWLFKLLSASLELSLVFFFSAPLSPGQSLIICVSRGTQNKIYGCHNF